MPRSSRTQLAIERSNPVRRRRWRIPAAALALVGLLGIAWAAPRFRTHRALHAAQTALRDRRPEDAVRILTMRQSQADSQGEVEFWLARAQRRSGRLSEAARWLRRSRTAGFDRERLAREEWLLAAQSGQLSEAEQHLPELLKTAGDDGAEICAAFVEGFTLNQRFQAAFHLLDAWQADLPLDPEPHFRRGYIWQLSSIHREAAQEYRAGLELAPHDYDARVRLGQSLLELQQPAEAEREFRTCLSQREDDVRALVGLGQSLVALRRDDEGRRCLERAIAEDPAQFEASLTLGSLAMDAGRFDEALRIAEQLQQQQPRDVTVRQLLAQSLIAVGRLDEAQPHQEWIRTAQEPLARLDSLLEQVVEHPRDAAVRLEIGRILLEFGSPDDAQRWLHTVLEVDPTNSDAHRLLADHYAASGDAARSAGHRRLSIGGGRVENADKSGQ